MGVFYCRGGIMMSFVPLCDRLWWMVTKVPCWWLIWNPTPSMSLRWGPSMQMPLGSHQLSRGKQVSVSSAVIPVCSLCVCGHRKKTTLKPYVRGLRDGWVGMSRRNISANVHGVGCRIVSGCWATHAVNPLKSRGFSLLDSSHHLT